MDSQLFVLRGLLVGFLPRLLLVGNVVGRVISLDHHVEVRVGRPERLAAGMVQLVRRLVRELELQVSLVELLRPVSCIDGCPKHFGVTVPGSELSEDQRLITFSPEATRPRRLSLCYVLTRFLGLEEACLDDGHCSFSCHKVVGVCKRVEPALLATRVPSLIDEATGVNLRIL